MNGRLIAFEGIDGSGKSSQAKLLEHWLEHESDAYLTEWNSSDWVHGLNKKAKKKKELNPLTFSLINATDFTDRYEKYIITMLKAGVNVVSDRYIYTAYARDSARGIDIEWIKNLYSFAVEPDIVFYIKIKPEDAILRLKNGRTNLKPQETGSDIFPDLSPDEGFIKYQTIISEFYDKLSRDKKFCIINGNDSIENVQKLIREKVGELLWTED
jgi:dTMP kinase